MTGALLESQAPRIEGLGREQRCSSTSTNTSVSTGTSASISTRSPPLYYGATPFVAGDDRRMNSQQLPKEFESSTGYDYLDIQASSNDMRYEHNANAPLSTIEGPPQQPTLLNLFNPPITTTTPYSTDGGFYHPVASHVFPSLDVRPRLGSNTSSTGMAHAHRSTALPHPGTQISARDQYSPATPSFRRISEHHPRSPSYPPALRRHPISPTSSPITGFTAPTALRMDNTSHYPPSASRNQNSVPPLDPITTLGVLQYADGGNVPVKVDIHGNIDKGFFQSDGDWTCYRRNYFSCVCSFSLSPHYPVQPLQFTQSGSTQPYNVVGFAMSISAVVADNDSHTIELVQHTPKRDKGPIAKPEKVRLQPKFPQPSHPLGLYPGHETALGGPSRLGFDGGGFSAAQQQGTDPYQTEHTFERIQFKQATANNGKRRAAQQYYHLLIELWADVGQGPDNFVRIAYRKSAKMIVRGRSPGHYQSERRASTSSGPGGSGGSLTGYTSSTMLGSDFSTGGSMMGGGYGTNFDSRGGPHYGTARHHPELEPMMSPEDAKAIDTTKEYQYYPGAIYEQADSRGGVDMFAHQRQGQDSTGPHMTSAYDPLQDRVKRDPEGGVLPSIFQPGALMSSQRCGTFEGKSSSGGYYPTIVQQPGVNLANMT